MALGVPTSTSTGANATGNRVPGMPSGPSQSPIIPGYAGNANPLNSPPNPPPNPNAPGPGWTPTGKPGDPGYWQQFTIPDSVTPWTPPIMEKLDAQRAQNTAMSDWLKSSLGLIDSNYQSQAQGLVEQGNWNDSRFGTSAGFINSDYENALAQLNLDRYRNVDLGRQGNDLEKQHASNIWGQMQTNITNQRGTTATGWQNMQTDIANRRGTTDAQIGIDRWLNDQQMGSNLTGRDLALDRAWTGYQDQRFNEVSGSTGRGAFGSRGMQHNLDTAAAQHNQAQRGAELDYGRTRDSLSATRQSNDVGYQAALNALANQYNVGSNEYNAAVNALDNQYGVGQNNYAYAMAQNQLANALNGSLGQTYDLRAEGLGLDRDKALFGNTNSRVQAAQQLAGQQSGLASQQSQQSLALQQMALGLGLPASAFMPQSSTAAARTTQPRSGGPTLRYR